jgi:hypothetical protein
MLAVNVLPSQEAMRHRASREDKAICSTHQWRYQLSLFPEEKIDLHFNVSASRHPSYISISKSIFYLPLLIMLGQ